MNEKYIGNTSQLFDIRQYKFTSGRASEVSAIDVWNGGNLHFTILPDRGMDIYTLRYRGVNIAYHSPVGITSPSYYSDISSKWLRTFGGGFLCTCGLQNIGSADGKDSELTVHGRISNTPAENVCVTLENEGTAAVISGVLREGVIFGSKLTMRRTIKCSLGCDEISIEDTVTNESFTDDAISMLYHFNIGYPMLSESAVPYFPSHTIVPRNAHAATDVDNWDKVLPPQMGYEEMCYYHFLTKNVIGIDNPSLDISLRIEYDSPIIDRAVQWRMFGCGDYVMGLEPASCSLEGRCDAVANGSQKYIQARKSIQNKINISFGKCGI